MQKDKFHEVTGEVMVYKSARDNPKFKMIKNKSK